MPNTVFGPFTPITVVQGSTPANATWGNNVQTQASDALHGFNPDLIGTGFVYSGITCTKDAVTANQLDIASGVAYVVFSDGTVGRITVVADNTHTTVTANATYSLYLQPDGTWFWATSGSPQANSLFIASVTTDGSGNIVTVTDQRTTTTTLLGSGVLAPVVARQSVASTVTPALVGTPIGGVTFGGAAAIAGDSSAGSATFNGTTGYVSFPSTGLPTGNGVWSILALFKFAANPATIMTIGAFGAATTHESACLYVDTSGILHAGTYNGDTTGGTALALNAYHLGVATWDGTTIRAYVDGAAYGTNATPGAMTIPATPTAQVGAQVTPFQYWNGQIAEAAFFAATLTAAQITALNTAITAGGFAAAVQALSPTTYYRLNEPSSALYANSSLPRTVQTIGPTSSHNLGRVASLGGQAAAGPLGAPVIVAQAYRVHVTATTLQTIISYTPSVTGIYRVSVAGSIQNPTPQKVGMSMTYADPDVGIIGDTFFSTTATGGVGNPLFLNQVPAATYGTAVNLATSPLVIASVAGNPIQVTFLDPGGTPNDFVSAIIERLA